MKEKWTADFSKPEKACFDIKPEIAYNANLEKNALFLGLKKKNCMAWLETASRVYVDQVIKTHFRFDSHEGHCAAGIMFRILEQGTYYLALISNRGYFRLDAIHNTVSRPLIGWIEAPGLREHPLSAESRVNLDIIAKDDHFTFILNGEWFAEARDTSIPGGHLGFALVSYDTETTANGGDTGGDTGEYTCRAWLDFLSVDSRVRAVKTENKKWNESANISVKNRFCLAESFAAINCFGAAHDQILKIWKQREEFDKTFTAAHAEIRTKGELLFAARTAMRIEQYAAAEEYINAYLAAHTGATAQAADLTDEKPEILIEKAKILSAQNKYNELIVFLPHCIKQMEDGTDLAGLPSLYALLGYAHWHLKNYKESAAAWDKAFSLDRNNGLYAVNAASAFEMTGKHKKALQRRLEGEKCFFAQCLNVRFGFLAIL